MNLEISAASLLDQFPNAQRASLQRQERNLERFGQIAFGGFGIVLLAAMIGIIYAIVTKMILTGANLWVGILLTAFVVFAGLALCYVVLNESLKEKRAKLHANASEEPLQAPDTDKLLEKGSFEPVPSVVDDTTDLLKAEVKTRRL